MRFRDDNPADLDRARAAVTAWREQHPAGTEDQLTAALGPQFHPDYGPVLAVGWGGTRVESLEPAVALSPIDRRGAEELVERAGLPPDAAALADVLLALNRIATEHPQVAEIDVNPLILTAQGSVAVDALVVVGG